MPRAASRDLIYYRRRYPPEVIELCAHTGIWYLAYRLGHRDLWWDALCSFAYMRSHYVLRRDLGTSTGD